MLNDDERQANAAAAAKTSDEAADSGRLYTERARERSAAGDPPLGPGRDPARYTLADEPVEVEAPVDYYYLYEIVAKQILREDERGRAMDAKLATLLAGVVAGIGFSFRTTPALETSAAAFLYVIPLGLIVFAYTTKIKQDAPRPDVLAANFPTFPVSTLKNATTAMVSAYTDNRHLHTAKATLFDFAVLTTFAVTVIVLISEVIVAGSSNATPRYPGHVTSAVKSVHTGRSPDPQR
jgi:hypothetical protein